MRQVAHPRGAIALLLALLVFGPPACTGGGGSGQVGKEPGFGIEDLDPVDGAIAVVLDSQVTATFTAPIKGTTEIEDAFVVSERASGKKVAGTFETKNANQIVIFTPAEDYRRNTQYRVEISDVFAVTGEEMDEEFVSYFRTLVSQEPPPPPPPPPPTGRIRSVGKLVVGRSSHQATRLADGQVLVTGGFDTSSTVTQVAEIFDPVLETFAKTTTTPAIARGFHAALLLGDGRVLVCGGVTGTGLAETDHAEVFHPSGESFSALTAKMVKQRAFHTVTLLADGRVLIAGGTVPTSTGVFSSRTAEVFDPAADSFTALPDMGVYRAAHTATTLGDGRVLIAGGNSTDKRVELFDPTTDSFTTLVGEMKMARRGHTANLLDDGTVVIMGGGDRSGELYVTDKAFFRWTPGFPLWDRKDHTATRLPNGRILFTGGSRPVGTVLFFNNTTELYDAPTGAYLGSQPTLSLATTRHRATTLTDGSVLITGGSNLDSTKPELKLAEIYESLQ